MTVDHTLPLVRLADAGAALLAAAGAALGMGERRRARSTSTPREPVLRVTARAGLAPGVQLVGVAFGGRTLLLSVTRSGASLLCDAGEAVPGDA
ncbi:MAG: hypothetical protein RQ833_11070 [Sphingomonadaceae bacterium]|nr:hypothetical protein [Sphingomonadaceae bacterium]